MVIHRLYDGYRSDETDSARLSFVFMTDENLMCVDAELRDVVSPFRKVNTLSLRTLSEVPENKNSVFNIFYLFVFITNDSKNQTPG